MSSRAESFACCVSWVSVIARVEASGGVDRATQPKVSREDELDWPLAGAVSGVRTVIAVATSSATIRWWRTSRSQAWCSVDCHRSVSASVRRPPMLVVSGIR